jgi:hypothetical protein
VYRFHGGIGISQLFKHKHISLRNELSNVASTLRTSAKCHPGPVGSVP